MPSPEPALVVIACPHCGTRYQVSYEAIGAKGREVTCAHCGDSWEAHAEPPSLPPPAPPQKPPEAVAKNFAELAEEALDQKIIDEERRQRERRANREGGGRKGPGTADAEGDADDTPAMAADEHQRTLDEIKAAVAVRPNRSRSGKDLNDPKRQREELRQRLHNLLPRTRRRRLARLGALGALVVVLGGGLLFRTPIVQQFPQLAAPYAALGLPVNVVGLTFDDVKTLKSLQQGAEVLVVDGKVHSVGEHEISVPQVVVTLLGAAGKPVYEWSVTPKAAELEPGETVAFETRLTAPPAQAQQVRLTFARMQASGKSATLPAGAGDAVGPDGPTSDETTGDGAS